MANVETKYNGHRERLEPIELMETIRSLKAEVQGCRVYNKRMIRAQENYNHLNDQLVLSVNRL